MKFRSVWVINFEKKKSKARTIGAEVSDDEESCQWLVGRGLIPALLCVAVFGLLVRVSVSLYLYSGAGDPPKYGDFESQRHWMEITTNLPAIEWHKNSNVNDSRYWGLDYPPLTSHHCYVHGLLLKLVHPESIALFTSRGHESYLGGQSVCGSDIVSHVAMILLNLCLIPIYHGHFQYNCISLGLGVAAVLSIGIYLLVFCSAFCSTISDSVDLA